MSIFGKIVPSTSRCLTAVTFLLFPFSASATGENFPIGTRPAALANVYVMQSDLWSVYHNQAGLGFHDRMSLGFHHENKFVVKEFSLHALGFTYPLKPGTIGFSYSYFGFEDYNVSKFGLGFGKSFGSNFAAGIQLNYHYVYIAGDFESQGTLSVEGGIQYNHRKTSALGYIFLTQPGLIHLNIRPIHSLHPSKPGLVIPPLKSYFSASKLKNTLTMNLSSNQELNTGLLKVCTLEQELVPSLSPILSV